MAMPPPPVAATSTSAPAAAVAPATASVPAANDGKIVFKKFGAAKNEAGEVIATPTANGLDLIGLSKSFYSTLTSACASANVALESVLEYCSNADKSQFPGHKDGRIAYATCNTVASLGKINGLLTKVRSLGGGAAMKKKIEEKDSKIAALEAQLAKLLAQMGK